MRRGGKKVICNILGFDNYGCNLADVASLLAKRFGSGAAEILVEFKEISQ
jgi:translation initiation factor 1 (eIF-1/SUI1)